MKLFPVYSDSEKAKSACGRLDHLDAHRRIVKDKPVELVTDPQKADYILVIGGDGTMLRAIHEYYEIGVPFFGLNYGTVGFLMNPPVRKGDDYEDCCGAIYGAFNDAKKNLKMISLNLLEVKASCVTRQAYHFTKKIYAFNDVYFNAPPGHSCRFEISGDHYEKKIVVGDGVIIATPQGSTAYNRNAGGPILPLGQEILAVTSICSSTRPIRDVVNFQPLSVRFSGEQGIVLHAVNIRIDGADWVEVSPTKISVRIAFGRDYNFETKRYNTPEVK